MTPPPFDARHIENGIGLQHAIDLSAGAGARAILLQISERIGHLTGHIETMSGQLTAVDQRLVHLESARDRGAGARAAWLWVAAALISAISGIAGALIQGGGHDIVRAVMTAIGGR